MVTDQLADRTPLADLPKTTRVFFGLDGLDEAVSSPDVDIVLSAIVGGAGLRGTWRSLEAGKTVALANKESLVLAGPLLFYLARKTAGESCRSTANIVRSGRRSLPVFADTPTVPPGGKEKTWCAV